MDAIRFFFFVLIYVITLGQRFVSDLTYIHRFLFLVLNNLQYLYFRYIRAIPGSHLQYVSVCMLCWTGSGSNLPCAGPRRYRSYTKLFVSKAATWGDPCKSKAQHKLKGPKSEERYSCNPDYRDPRSLPSPGVRTSTAEVLGAVYPLVALPYGSLHVPSAVTRPLI